MAGAQDSALAISNFLRQHDLVQVLWVTLSSGSPEHPSETMRTLVRELPLCNPPFRTMMRA